MDSKAGPHATLSLSLSLADSESTLADPRIQNDLLESGFSFGQLLLGRYEIRRLLGRGAFGEVLAVRDAVSGGQDFALKRLLADRIGDPLALKAIRQNFALVHSLAHPHIATMRMLEMEAGTGNIYLVMDLVHGIDLGKWIAAKRLESSDEHLPVDLALAIAEQIAAALDYAHSVPNANSPMPGILHRDLKPANIMLEVGREYRPDVPFAKLVDFGLASEVQATLLENSITATNTIAGTPSYMAPEQFEGGTLTRGVDQWALAVILYEMIGGKRPFYGLNLESIEAKVLAANPVQPPQLNDREWAALKTAFNPDRKKRHRTCGDLVRAIEIEKHAVPVPPPPAPAPLKWQNEPRWVWREPVLNLLRGVSMTFVRVAAGAFEMGSTDNDDESPVHSVTLPNDYFIGQYPVTVAQFKLFIDETGYQTEAELGSGGQVYENGAWFSDATANWRNTRLNQDPSHPVVLVSWNDAQTFLKWINQEAQIPLRLPSEAEWEYAARGPQNNVYPWGNEFDPSKCNHGGHAGQSIGTSPVGRYPNASWCGAMDMAGNVWQWCWDGKRKYKATPEIDPNGGTSQVSYHTVRGGSWYNRPAICRATTRNWDTPIFRDSGYGFRCVLPIK